MDQQESKLQKLSAFLAETGKPLDFDCVAAWLDSLGLASKTKAQYINAGATFWKWAMKYDVKWREDFKGAANPFENHDLLRPGARRKPMLSDWISACLSWPSSTMQPRLSDWIRLQT